MKVDVILGLQHGDEGKGRVVDNYVQENGYGVVVRFQGGPNAGHTINVGGKEDILHTIPSGAPSGRTCLIGAGVVIYPPILEEEISMLEGSVDIRGILKVDSNANLIMPSHLWLDKASEKAKGRKKIGSTLKGIGPTYMDKTGRNVLKVRDICSGDFWDKYNALKAKHMQLLSLYAPVDFNIEEQEWLWFDAIEKLIRLDIVSSSWLHEQMGKGAKVLAEGAQGSLLDLDWGTYPYVTSSNTTIGGVLTGLGISHKDIGTVTGVAKAYATRVGNGQFPTELTDEIGDKLREKGGEYGATTGRPRRCGWLNLPELRYSCRLNGVDKLIFTKMDVLSAFDEIKVCHAYKYGNKIFNTCPDMNLNLDHVELIYETYPGWTQDISEIRAVVDLPQECTTFVDEISAELPQIERLTVGARRKAFIKY